MPNTSPPCWPDDPDYLDGRTEIRVPPARALRAYWDADLLDNHGVRPGTIIAVTDPFQVRFRVELVGDLWRCLSGCWCFELCFTPIGKGAGFDLSDKLPADAFKIRNWRGCETRCIELVYEVPAGSVPAEHCGTLYEVGARFALHCCCDDEHRHERPILVGYEALEEREFY